MSGSIGSRQTWWVVAGIAVGLYGGVAGAVQTEQVKPVATVGQLHDAMINPSSDALFDVGRAEPRSEADWIAVRNAAVILLESSNLLMLEGRAVDDGPWMEMSREMLDASEAALTAAEAENLDGVIAAGGRIVEVCEACHEPYRDGGRAMGPPPDAAPLSSSPNKR